MKYWFAVVVSLVVCVDILAGPMSRRRRITGGRDCVTALRFQGGTFKDTSLHDFEWGIHGGNFSGSQAKVIQTNGTGVLDSPSVNDAITLTDTFPPLDFGFSDFTIMGWFNTSTNYTARGLDGDIYFDFGPGGTAFAGLTVWVSSNTMIGGFHDTVCNDNSVLTPAPVVNDGKWHHGAIVRSNVNGKIYVDGTLIKSQDVAAMNDVDLAVSFNPAVGNRDSGPTRALFGQIDEVFLHRRALSDHEIGLFYTREKARKP